MATHSGILVWTEEPDELKSMGSPEDDLATEQQHTNVKCSSPHKILIPSTERHTAFLDYTNHAFITSLTVKMSFTQFPTTLLKRSDYQCHSHPNSVQMSKYS